MKEKIEKEIVFFITVFIPANRVDMNDYDGRVSAALAFSNDSIESSANIAIVASKIHVMYSFKDTSSSWKSILQPIDFLFDLLITQFII